MKHIISLGAGVQSSTMALMAAHGEITPMPDAAIFADTQAEPASVYKWLDWLETQLPFPVYRVTHGSLETDHLRLRVSGRSGRTYLRTLVPFYVAKHDGTRGIVYRKCTAEYKITPLINKVKEIAEIGRGGKTVKAMQWIGISLDEAIRMKPSQIPSIEHRWPLIELRMSRTDCLLWMEKHNYPRPPRSSCVFCPYHSDNEWRRLRDDEPKEFQRAVEWERQNQALNVHDETAGGKIYLHKTCKPLDEVDFSTAEDRGQLSLFGNECEGMCGV